MWGACCTTLNKRSAKINVQLGCARVPVYDLTMSEESHELVLQKSAVYVLVVDAIDPAAGCAALRRLSQSSHADFDRQAVQHCGGCAAFAGCLSSVQAAQHCEGWSASSNGGASGSSRSRLARLVEEALAFSLRARRANFVTIKSNQNSVSNCGADFGVLCYCSRFSRSCGRLRSTAETDLIFSC